MQKVFCQHPSNDGKMSQKVATVQKKLVASITIRPLKRSAFPCTKNRNTQNRFCTFCKKFSVNILQITAKCRKKLQPYKKISCKHHNTPFEKVSLFVQKTATRKTVFALLCTKEFVFACKNTVGKCFFNTRQARLHVSLLLQISREKHRHKEKHL